MDTFVIGALTPDGKLLSIADDGSYHGVTPDEELPSLKTVSAELAKWPRWISMFCSSTAEFDSMAWDGITSLTRHTCVQLRNFLLSDNSRNEFLKASALANTPVIRGYSKPTRSALLACYQLGNAFSKALGFQWSVSQNVLDRSIDLLARVNSAGNRSGRSLDEVAEHSARTNLRTRIAQSIDGGDYIISETKRLFTECCTNSASVKQSFMEGVKTHPLFLEELALTERAFLTEAPFISWHEDNVRRKAAQPTFDRQFTLLQFAFALTDENSEPLDREDEARSIRNSFRRLWEKGRERMTKPAVKRTEGKSEFFGLDDLFLIAECDGRRFCRKTVEKRLTRSPQL